MAKEKKTRGNVYDRIFRENAEYLFLPLIERELGLKILKYQALPTKLVKTSEREVDFLYQVQFSNQEEWLLHLEFQSQNDPKMLLRMQDYHGRAMLEHDLPIRHVVLYLGKGTSSMPSKMEPNKIFDGYDTINLQSLSTEELLSSQVPEVVLLALLSYYEREQTEKILRSIVERLQSLVAQPADLQRYINQLLVLSRLRHLESTATKLLSTMPITYDIEKDGLYQKGIKKGVKQGIEKGIKQGIEKGVKQGIEKGVKQGIEKGVKQGIEQGEERQLKKSILALHKEQMSVSRIARILATPADKVLRIIEEWEAEQSG